MRILIFWVLLLPFLHAQGQTASAAGDNLISAADFNALFPLRDKFYTYSSFIDAVHYLARFKIRIEKRGTFTRITRLDRNSGKEVVVRQDKDWNAPWVVQKAYSIAVINYSSFCRQQNKTVNKIELAAFFAQAAHETRHGENGKLNDGLMLRQEAGTSNAYVTDNPVYPAAGDKKYYGRGPLQLSYNGNYGFASDCIFGDKHKLLDNPDLAANDPVIAFETAIYFWMTPQGLKPSAHDAITGRWKPAEADRSKGWSPGFGMTTNIINGTLECNKGENAEPMQNRAAYYKYFLNKMGVKDSRQCLCGSMQPVL